MSELTDCINNLSAKDIIRSVAKTANGVPFYLQTVGGGFCSEYQRIYDDLAGSGTPPGAAVAAAQNRMVCGWVDDGVWAKFDIFYLFAQTTNVGGEALMNWVSSGLYNATAFNAPVFTALEGFLGDSATTYIDTGWDPANNGVNFMQDSASIGVYVRVNSLDGFDMGTADDVGHTNGIELVTRWGAGNSYIRNNTATSSSVGNADSRGLFINNRVLSTHQDLYKNKIRTINGAVASAGLTASDLFCLAINIGGGATAQHTDRQLSMAFAGGGLTQTDIDNITDRFEVYMDSNGKGVIP